MEYSIKISLLFSIKWKVNIQHNIYKSIWISLIGFFCVCVCYCMARVWHRQAVDGRLMTLVGKFVSITQCDEWRVRVNSYSNYLKLTMSAYTMEINNHRVCRMHGKQHIHHHQHFCLVTIHYYCHCGKATHDYTMETRQTQIYYMDWMATQSATTHRLQSTSLVSFFNFHSTPWHDNFNFIYLYLSFQFSSCLPCEQVFWHIFPWCYLTSVGWLTQDVCQPNERPQIVTYTNTCATWCFTLFFLLL